MTDDNERRRKLAQLDPDSLAAALHWREYIAALGAEMEQDPAPARPETAQTGEGSGAGDAARAVGASGAETGAAGAGAGSVAAGSQADGPGPAASGG